jgi:hypothetical protein
MLRGLVASALGGFCLPGVGGGGYAEGAGAG